jgi:putative two-component system response regulator
MHPMKKTVLIIDDEPGLVSLLEEHLGRHYHILKAYDGETGIRLALDKKPDALICDIRMPNKDGIEVLRTLRKDHFEETRLMAIIMLTVVADTESIGQLMSMGATDYCIKPIHLDEMLQLLHRYLDPGTS